MAFLLLLLFFLPLVILLVALVAFWDQQDRLLLQPSLDSHLNAYLKAHGSCVPLTHGGQLWKPNCLKPSRRNVLICHGNAGSINQMEPIVHTILKEYNVFLLEYHGFGMNFRSDRVPSLPGLVEDLDDAWTTQIEDPRHTILLGFSMGGGTIAQFLQTRVAQNRLPEQIVLINSFESLHRMAKDCLCAAATLLLKSKNNWYSGPGLQRYLYFSNKKKQQQQQTQANSNAAQIVLVHALDDPLIKPTHFKALEQQIYQFTNKHCNNKETSFLKRVELPDGGHESSMFFHARLWLKELLCPRFLVA